jgi:hypothetical protein
MHGFKARPEVGWPGPAERPRAVKANGIGSASGLRCLAAPTARTRSTNAASRQSHATQCPTLAPAPVYTSQSSCWVTATSIAVSSLPGPRCRSQRVCPPTENRPSPTSRPLTFYAKEDVSAQSKCKSSFSPRSLSILFVSVVRPMLETLSCVDNFAEHLGTSQQRNDCDSTQIALCISHLPL